MSRWRTAVILFLLIAPLLVFVGFGAWALWQSGQVLWLWVGLLGAWALAMILARLWHAKIVPLKPPKTDEPLHWTPRDRKAWDLVEERIKTADNVDPEELTKLQFYVDVARDLSKEIAQCYHPKAADPISSLTIPEIMAAAQLALEDLSDLYDQYVPGGQMLTVSNWKTLSKLPKRYKLISNLVTAGMAIFSPFAALGRYAASKTVMAPVSKAIQSNILTWFYASYLQRAGFYLIEMNSGRLRGGKEKFREAFERFRRKDKPWNEHAEETKETEAPANEEHEPATESAVSGVESEAEARRGETDESQTITVCVVGQAGAGRSSLVKALLTDAPEGLEPEKLKKASTVTVHRIPLPDSGDELRVLETVGYSSFEESKSIRKDRFRAIAEADLLLLVMNAASPARDADVEFLQDMDSWFEEQPQLKPPAIIAVLTHIDLLKPPMVWDPPYNWEEPAEMKEESIRDAVEHIRGELDGRAIAVVPVCSDIENQRAWGIRESLEPVIIAALDEARAVSTVRHLHKDLDTGKVSRVLKQVWNLGKALRGK